MSKCSGEEIGNSQWLLIRGQWSVVGAKTLLTAMKTQAELEKQWQRRGEKQTKRGYSSVQWELPTYSYRSSV